MGGAAAFGAVVASVLVAGTLLWAEPHDAGLRTAAFAVLASLLATWLARATGVRIGRALEREVAREVAEPAGERAASAVESAAAQADAERERSRMAETERIAARRDVARRVAHEIKNPLAPIRAAVETLRRLRARDDPAFDDYFDEATRTVLDEVRRISDIVTKFTELERLPAPTLADVELVEVAEQVAVLHQNALDGRTAKRGPSGERLRRVEVSAEGPVVARADRDQLVQLLTNLVQNGLDAALAVRDDPRVVVTVETIAEEGRMRARVVVRDNGPGVAEAQLARLFEPYATTKEGGTGLGLAIARRIALEHGGDLTYRTGQKGGAVFELSLPLRSPDESV